MTVSDGTQGHYERLAESYDEAWSHRPDYLTWMSDQVQRRLRMAEREQFADIGAGTGLFLQRLAERARREVPILCIDPSAAMLDQIPDDPRLRPIRATAEDVAAARVALPYDKLDGILIKETIHHVTNVAATMRGLADWLVPGGRVLVVSLPPRLEYPLFQAALDRFAAGQPEPETIVEAMRAAGLDAECTFEEYPVTVDRDHYIDLVAHQWMSVLSTFGDDELAAGLDEMRRRYPRGQLSFVDRFAFVLGVRT